MISDMPLRWLLTCTLAIAVGSVLGAAELAIGEHRAYLPETVNEKTPLVVVEAGVAVRFAPLAAFLNKADVAVLEVAGLRQVQDIGEPTHAALAALFQQTKELAQSPRVLVGFSAKGPAALQTAMANPKQWSGLLLVNSMAAPHGLPKEPDEAQAAIPIMVLHGTQDPVVKQKQAQQLVDSGKSLKMTFSFASVATKDHFGPFKEATGQKAILEFVEKLKAPTSHIDTANAPAVETSGKMSTITTATADGVTLTADLYRADKETKTVVILFHMAGSSRGEYRRIAPTLTSQGWDCLAVDLRGGAVDRQSRVVNQTARSAAKKQGAKTNRNLYGARADVEQALNWAVELGYEQIAAVGSSYSASHLLLVAPVPQLKALACLSPGEYFGKQAKVSEGAKRITVPTFICAGRQEDRQLKPLTKALPKPLTTVGSTKSQGHGSILLENDVNLLEDLIAFLRDQLSKE